LDNYLDVAKWDDHLAEEGTVVEHGEAGCDIGRGSNTEVVPDHVIDAC
jgi:hypothetical protein